MLGTPAYNVPTESLLTAMSMMILSSGVICGVTVRLSVALLKATFVAPLLEACWYGTSVPASIRAWVLSDVTTRGLEITLPLLSVSRADNSMDNSLLIDLLNNSMENAPAVPADGRLTLGRLMGMVVPASGPAVTVSAPMLPLILDPAILDVSVDR